MKKIALRILGLVLCALSLSACLFSAQEEGYGLWTPPESPCVLAWKGVESHPIPAADTALYFGAVGDTLFVYHGQAQDGHALVFDLYEYEAINVGDTLPGCLDRKANHGKGAAENG